MEFVHDAMTSGVWIYLKNLTLYFLALKEVGCGSVPQRCWNGEIEVKNFRNEHFGNQHFFEIVIITFWCSANMSKIFFFSFL